MVRNQEASALNERYEAMFQQESEKHRLVSDKQGLYKEEFNRLLRENEAAKKEKNQLDKEATQSHVEVERVKNRNVELVQAIKVAKQNPSLIQQVNTISSEVQANHETLRLVATHNRKAEEKHAECQEIERQIRQL